MPSPRRAIFKTNTNNQKLDKANLSTTQQALVERVRVGDIVIVRVGDIIPVDDVFISFCPLLSLT